MNQGTPEERNFRKKGALNVMKGVDDAKGLNL
jgi:hypothetical protein